MYASAWVTNEAQITRTMPSCFVEYGKTLEFRILGGSL
jgi:hypothetical protein